MSEFRQNPVTGQWVLIAPNRAKRPEDYRPAEKVMHGLREHDETCVFCPGKKESDNKELYRDPKKGDWRIRVIENKFHALDKIRVYEHKDFYLSRAGDGAHEVIITRPHNEPVALQSMGMVEDTLEVVQERFKELSRRPDISYVQLFHNHGREAGASLVHPHYQILATPFVPPHIHSEMLGCYHYWKAEGKCVYCAIIDSELKVRDRIVFESEHFVVISAYASRSPFETWILPKRHGGRFEEVRKEELKHLSFVLKVTLAQLYTKLGDPPLNFYVHTMPTRNSEHTAHAHESYHWHFTIFPRISTWAGFEFATGIAINPVSPEVTAEFLRGRS